MAVHQTLIVFLQEMRKSVKILVSSVVICTAVIFFLSPELLQLVQAHLSDELYFFSVAGPFLAHIKLALFGSLFVLMPLIMTFIWRAIAKPFGVSGLALYCFIVATCLLFYVGTMFCYLITLPFGIKFLLGYGSAELRPVISVGRFVNFVTIFVLAFGLIFELPIFMIFLAKVQVVSRKFFEKNRRYALLAIAVAAAVLTPTPDVVNMLLMGGPLYLLYEGGIITMIILRIR
ncbi:twin-arginine translocase subunit TatC [Desulfotalea psychrophila]|uniref:Sec-independent protein translocase protein TatC n=1 Tax=Desulfotalea psychrophila (strain LSv54 / DSM 12343) TaxID=177439 RepID=Q6AMD3_DESPS|nr:twin-arginine translocase subunit TatC [Desulfotalea psychrophila]CAG36492.1 related to Sec-independent protein translocase protein TatC [Desulfotalea psychrophila LSv54]